MTYITGCSTRNSLNVCRDWREFRSNYKSLLGLRVPHMDTVDTLLERIPPEQLGKLLHHLVKILINKRVFHKFKLLNDHFTVAIDGTGIFTFDKEPYPGCPNKTSKNGKVTYSQSFVEAKLVCANGFSISLGTEWFINDDGSSKQDCETKATKRLLAKLHSDFPRLPVCVVMDGLFLNYPIQKLIHDYKWESIIVWKDKTKYKLQDQIAKRRDNNQLKIKEYTEFPNSCTREEYVLEYSEEALLLETSKKKSMEKGLNVYYLKGEKTRKSTKKEVENEHTKFMFMSTIQINKSTVKEIFEGGRLRWKIENEGFNEQKNGVLKMHHKMNRNNLTAIKNYYTCLQIAHLIMQLICRAKNSMTGTYLSTRMIWTDLCLLLRLLPDYIPQPLKTKFNLRY